MQDSTRKPTSFVDHQVASDYHFTRSTEAQAIANGFTLKAYRGTSRACLFNGTGTTWASTVASVATSYAVDVHCFPEPVVAVLMVNPSGLPRMDASALTPAQRDELQADEFGNPQVVGIYERSDDHCLGGDMCVTSLHVPIEAVVRSRTPAASPSACAFGSPTLGAALCARSFRQRNTPATSARGRCSRARPRPRRSHRLCKLQSTSRPQRPTATVSSSSTARRKPSTSCW